MTRFIGSWMSRAHRNHPEELAMSLKIVMLVGLCSLSPACSLESRARACASEYQSSLSDQREAILAARRIWFCANPRLQPTSEDHWLREFVATRHGDTWLIWQTLPEGYVGGQIVIDLTVDGRVLGILETQ